MNIILSYYELNILTWRGRVYSGPISYGSDSVLGLQFLVSSLDFDFVTLLVLEFEEKKKDELAYCLGLEIGKPLLLQKDCKKSL